MTGEMSMGAALICLGALAWLLGGRHYGVRRARLLFAGGGAVATGPPTADQLLSELRRLCGRWGAEWWALAAGLVLAVLGASVIPAVAGAAGVPVLRRVRLAQQARRTRERRADAVIALCGVLAGEVRAGRQPGEALLRAAQDSGGLGDAQAAVVAAARFGGDVPGALAVAARQPGAEGLPGLAACWRVAVDQGAGLAA
ncbi:type II secretion system F family protein, partial [Streptomyces sp. AF1A]|uniref:type II secretion system F family protein n=1 Tax=Streptomyces sp. AF1A TaxID=3394350 RepID=UPI0039BC89D7